MNMYKLKSKSPYRSPSQPAPSRLVHHLLVGAAGLALAISIAGQGLEASNDKRWKDTELVQAYSNLVSRGGLEDAVLSPVLPSHPAQKEFLDALAWYAAGTPASAGTLTVDELDEFLRIQSHWYIDLLRARVEDSEDNDYGRTRTWKVIQKLTMLREQMTGPEYGGSYPYPAITQVPDGDDPWEEAHTLDSPEEFQDKVCQGSNQRPVLVKFGNTNCTQCMLFEMIGSVKELAQSPQLKDSVDVYKVWWGLQPDDSFAGKIRYPKRLDALAQAEGVNSSPYFIVYRNGRRYPCGDAFPDLDGSEEHLAACLSQDFAELPIADACTSTLASSS